MQCTQDFAAHHRTYHSTILFFWKSIKMIPNKRTHRPLLNQQLALYSVKGTSVLFDTKSTILQQLPTSCVPKVLPVFLSHTKSFLQRNHPAISVHIIVIVYVRIQICVYAIYQDQLYQHTSSVWDVLYVGIIVSRPYQFGNIYVRRNGVHCPITKQRSMHFILVTYPIWVGNNYWRNGSAKPVMFAIRWLTNLAMAKQKTKILLN